MVAPNHHHPRHANTRQYNTIPAPPTTHRPRRTLTGKITIQPQQDPDKPNPTFLPYANEVAQRLADKTGGIAQSWAGEVLLNTPVTAHILGGAITAIDASRGVIDMNHRVF